MLLKFIKVPILDQTLNSFTTFLCTFVLFKFLDLPSISYFSFAIILSYTLAQLIKSSSIVPFQISGARPETWLSNKLIEIMAKNCIKLVIACYAISTFFFLMFTEVNERFILESLLTFFTIIASDLVRGIFIASNHQKRSVYMNSFSVVFVLLSLLLGDLFGLISSSYILFCWAVSQSICFLSLFNFMKCISSKHGNKIVDNILFAKLKRQNVLDTILNRTILTLSPMLFVAIEAEISGAFYLATFVAASIPQSFLAALTPVLNSKIGTPDFKNLRRLLVMNSFLLCVLTAFLVFAFRKELLRYYPNNWDYAENYILIVVFVVVIRTVEYVYAMTIQTKLSVKNFIFYRSVYFILIGPFLVFLLCYFHPLISLIFLCILFIFFTYVTLRFDRLEVHK